VSENSNVLPWRRLRPRRSDLLPFGMLDTLQLQLLLATFAAWANRKQAGIIAYLIEENGVRKEQLDSSGSASVSPMPNAADWP